MARVNGQRSVSRLKSRSENKQLDDGGVKSILCLSSTVEKNVRGRRKCSWGQKQSVSSLTPRPWKRIFKSQTFDGPEQFRRGEMENNLDWHIQASPLHRYCISCWSPDRKVFFLFFFSNCSFAFDKTSRWLSERTGGMRNTIQLFSSCTVSSLHSQPLSHRGPMCPL